MVDLQSAIVPFLLWDRGHPEKEKDTGENVDTVVLGGV